MKLKIAEIRHCTLECSQVIGLYEIRHKLDSENVAADALFRVCVSHSPTYHAVTEPPCATLLFCTGT